MLVVGVCFSVEPALAARVSLEDGVLHYRSAPGERDGVEVSLAAGIQLALFSDRLSVGPGCADQSPPSGAQIVRCPLRARAPLPRLRVELGDRADDFAVSEELLGGAQLRGEFYGGAGNDRITGMGLLLGGLGDDSVFAEGRNPVVRGGAGDDDLMVVGSNPGRGRLYGGPGRDFLEGGDGRDLLRGGAGTDSLQGLGGRDLIDPGQGVDEVDAETGGDVVTARDGRFDYIECLEGRDTVMLDRFDLYERDCERVRRRGVARSVLYGAGVYETASGQFKELEIDFTCPFDGPRVCDTTFDVYTSRHRVLHGFVTTRGLGDQGWLWDLRPRTLVALTNWARITMRTRDALGRPYTQTIVCPEGVTVSEYSEPEGALKSARRYPRGGAAHPLTNSRTCRPPLSSLDPFE
jgi:RTX calcium-binding nonapeptide repeat (4 copies)